MIFEAFVASSELARMVGHAVELKDLRLSTSVVLTHDRFVLVITVVVAIVIAQQNILDTRHIICLSKVIRSWKRKRKKHSLSCILKKAVEENSQGHNP